MEKKQILIVDDIEVNLIFLKHLLNSINPNLEVQFASNGKECLKAVSEKNFDLVFLDLDMPQMTGQEVIKQLSLTKAYDLMKKIVIHSSSSFDMEGLKNYPLCGYLDKPTRKEVVLPLFSSFA